MNLSRDKQGEEEGTESIGQGCIEIAIAKQREAEQSEREQRQAESR